MHRDSARSPMRSVVHYLSLAGVGALTLSLPAIWLTWEAAVTQSRAALLMEAASTRAQAGLSDMFARFERATGSLTARDLQGDTVSLTGRLLRAEPLVAPASGLMVINNRGSQIASSSVGPAGSNGPVWWFRALPLPQTRRAVVLGCATTPGDGSGWILARGIETAPDVIVGNVGSALPDAALRERVAPADTVLDYTLRDADGCVLLHGDAAATVRVPNAPLARLYRALLPMRWFAPEPTVSTVRVGNLSWTGTISPSAATGLRATEIDRHAGIVSALVLAFGALTLLLAISPLFGRATVKSPLVDEPSGEDEADLRHRLDELAAQRDHVLAAIGHDVRTPMNSILGICALLLDGDLDETQRKWLRRIRASCEALLAMLNGMLEIAAAQVDGAEIHRESVDVASLVEEVTEVLRPQAEDKGLDLLVTIEESVLGVWNTDPTRLRQVLFNLCGNAIKYTPHGSVEIRALAGQDTLRLLVSDTGPGIAAEEREVIFEQFRRGHDQASRGQEGLGLGLALCREIATLLGGSLTLESAEDVGSVFTFEIPAERGQAPAGRDGPLAGRTALVVGLSVGVRRRVASHLESIGFDVETSGDGFMAIGLAERMAFQHGSLDLMVLDGALTGLSADALLVRLQAIRPLEQMRTVLVANGLTAAPAAGRADVIVPHPVEARDLDHVVAGFFGGRSPLREVDPGAPAAPRSRVLVVEDNWINQALCVDQLNRAGFSTFAAGNGEEAVEAVRRGGFDAILMDVQMPDVDGTEATRRIHAEAWGRRIPIIGMTAHTGSAVRRRCLDAGMTLVLHKPVDFSFLLLRLREVIAGAQIAAGSDTGRDGPAVAEGTLDIDDEYLQILVAEVGVRRARICVTAFVTDTVIHVAAMEQLMVGGEWEELGRLAHSLAGIAGTLGAISLADGLMMLEDAVRIEGQPHAVAALNEVRATWERTRVALRPRFEVLASGRGGPEARKVA